MMRRIKVIRMSYTWWSIKLNWLLTLDTENTSNVIRTKLWTLKTMARTHSRSKSSACHRILKYSQESCTVELITIVTRTFLKKSFVKDILHLRYQSKKLLKKGRNYRMRASLRKMKVILKMNMKVSPKMKTTSNMTK